MCPRSARDAGVHCTCRAAVASSHYKIAHVSQNLILTIPYKRPIKPIYIRKLVAFIDAVDRRPMKPTDYPVVIEPFPDEDGRRFRR